jgi:hypothetical protein
MKKIGLLCTACVFVLVIVAFNPSTANADIHVYDKNNQYLGILLDLTDAELSIFVPSLSASYYIEWDEIGHCDDIYFDSANCSGTPYRPGDEPLPEIMDLSSTPIEGFHLPNYNGKRTFTPGSYYDWNCQCQIGTYSNDEYIPLTQIQMPFTTPIVLPLSFKIETTTELMSFPIVVAPKNK